ncbi:MAG: hypothetical protein Solivirus1_77 [Solivirus sp.]|jgi:hypothetical protein|uniref:Uncharacterized protein n=1 Tax=Solivirus sp. TaxID=2487772 RepID=A0A3G5AFF3_9VIRU|nr:MAG: hypothetical protein Solivirus1_77 [Solivirus sp.]
MSIDLAGERGKKELLISLPFEDFQRVCSTNKEFNSYCNEYPHSEELFKERSYRWIHPDYFQFKEPIMTWKDFYLRVVNLTREIASGKRTSIIAHNAAYQGNIFELRILEKFDPNFNFSPHDSEIIFAAIYGDKPQILEWAKSHGVLPTEIDYQDAKERNRENVVKWMEANGIGKRLLI